MKNNATNNQGAIFIKALLVFFGVLLLLFTLEITLRLSGLVYAKMGGRKVTTSSGIADSPTRFTVLCLGDSYTYGLGTTFENSYPSQLEKILECRKPNESFLVINQGSPGGNTHRIESIFKDSLRKNKPHVAIVMAGHNNSWNVEGESEFFLPTPINKLIAGFRGLRVYKLIILIMRGLQNKIAGLSATSRINDVQGKENKHVPGPSTQECGQFYNPKQQVYVPQGEWDNLYKSIVEYRRLSQASLAISSIKKALDKYPGSCQLEKELIGLLRQTGENDAAIAYANRVINNCCIDQGDRGYIHLELLYAYRAKKSWLAARKEIDLLLKNTPAIGEVFAELQALSNKESGMSFEKEAKDVRKLIEQLYGSTMVATFDRLEYLARHKDNLEKMIWEDLVRIEATARGNGITLVLMTYPCSTLANEVIKKFALNNRITLVDNELIFNSTPQKEKLFVADKHCNADGYKLIAENIYAALNQTGVCCRPGLIMSGNGKGDNVSTK